MNNICKMMIRMNRTKKMNKMRIYKNYLYKIVIKKKYNKKMMNKTSRMIYNKKMSK
jgi:hypothetical protein